MIKPKKKPCKAQGKSKGHIEGCKTPSDQRKYGLCPKCYAKFLLETDLGQELLNKAQITGKKKVEKAEKQKDKEKRIELTNWRNKLQTKVQEISRLIDIGLPCLARGYHAGQIHGGHIYSKGGNKTIALNLHNIHRQSAQSNNYSNEDGLFREGLIKEYGQGYFNFISGLRRCEALKYSNMEYHEFYQKACKIALELKKSGENFDLKGRIVKRNEINIELGIYDKDFCVYNI